MKNDETQWMYGKIMIIIGVRRFRSDKMAVGSPPAVSAASSSTTGQELHGTFHRWTGKQHV